MKPIIWRARAFRRGMLIIHDKIMAQVCEAGAVLAEGLKDELQPKRVLSCFWLDDRDMT